VSVIGKPATRKGQPGNYLILNFQKRIYLFGATTSYNRSASPENINWLHAGHWPLDITCLVTFRYGYTVLQQHNCTKKLYTKRNEASNLTCK